MSLLYFLVSLLASIIGGICGVGGGVIIKPVLDATGTMTIHPFWRFVGVRSI